MSARICVLYMYVRAGLAAFEGQTVIPIQVLDMNTTTGPESAFKEKKKERKKERKKGRRVKERERCEFVEEE